MKAQMEKQPFYFINPNMIVHKIIQPGIESLSDNPILLVKKG